MIRKSKKLSKIMVTGAQGQIGQELLEPLVWVYGPQNVLFTDLVKKSDFSAGKQFEFLDVLDEERFMRLTREFRPDLLMHLPCMLSGTSEKNVYKSFEVNIDSFISAVKAAKETQARLFCPSSIASFGFKSDSDRVSVSDRTF